MIKIIFSIGFATLFYGFLFFPVMDIKDPRNPRMSNWDLFANMKEQSFPICRRELFTEMSDDLVWRYSSSPVLSYEVVCLYNSAVAPHSYSELSDKWEIRDEGGLVSRDTRILDAAYTINCISKSRPPPWTHHKGWLKIENDYYCPMPRLGLRPLRD